MCAKPWCTMRFSPRFLNAFFFVGRPAFFLSPPSGGADASIGSFFAINIIFQFPATSASLRTSSWKLQAGGWKLDGLLFSHRTLARTLARAGVRLRPLAAHRQIPPVPQAAIAADLHQPLDVHGDLLAEIAFDAPLLLDHPADLPHVVFGEILDADVGADGRGAQDVIRALPSDAINVGEPDFDTLRSRKIDASNACHSLDPCRNQLPAASSGLELSLSLFMFLIRAD